VARVHPTATVNGSVDYNMTLVKYYNGHAYQFCVANYYHTGEISIEAYEPTWERSTGRTTITTMCSPTMSPCQAQADCGVVHGGIIPAVSLWIIGGNAFCLPLAAQYENKSAQAQAQAQAQNENKSLPNFRLWVNGLWVNDRAARAGLEILPLSLPTVWYPRPWTYGASKEYRI